MATSVPIETVEDLREAAPADRVLASSSDSPDSSSPSKPQIDDGMMEALSGVVRGAQGFDRRGRGQRGGG